MMLSLYTQSSINRRPLEEALDTALESGRVLRPYHLAGLSKARKCVPAEADVVSSLSTLLL